MDFTKILIEEIETMFEEKIDVGSWIVQKRSDANNYAYVIEENKGGGWKVCMCDDDRKVPAISSTKGWYPAPQLISKDQVDKKCLDKILSHMKKKNISMIQEEYVQTTIDNIIIESDNSHTPEQFKSAISLWVREIESRWHTKMDPKDVFTMEEGKKFIKIVRGSVSGSKSVHGFIDKATGDVLKAAGWKAPAKGARGNIFDQHKGLSRIDAHGFIGYNK